jgi:NADH-quinone oxidoreductase subunit I
VFGSGLIKGLGITGKRLVAKPQCENYPFERELHPLPKASRIFLAMTVDESGAALCKACMTCVKGCPDNVIRIEKDPDDVKKALTFTVNCGRCTFCGLCVENCPFDALHWTQDFERATNVKADLIYKLIDDGAATGEGDQ